jgi:NTE family protein
MANLRTPLPDGTSLTTIDPVVDVVGLFDPQPGLLRINKDYGWLRAADVLAEGDPDLLADVAASTHALVDARRQAWHLEHSLWATKMPKDGNSVAGTLSLVREQKARVRAAVEQRKQLGFPVPDGCEAWWTEYEFHVAECPPHLPVTPVAPA